MDVDSEDDPVVAEYNIFMTPEQRDSQLYILQYPNRKRNQPYDAANHALPIELRLKPTTGFMEIDIGVSTVANFDKIKGLAWGQAMKHAKDAGSRGFGLSAGFGKGNAGTEVMVSGAGGRRRGGGGEDEERMLSEFDVTKERGGVLVKQTLGGQIKSAEDGRPHYMVGTFKGNELHLSEVTGTTQMRPQFHHIDAQSQITKTTIARSNAGKQKSKEPTAVINVPRNQLDDQNTASTKAEETDKFLTAAADENWTRLRYRDEEDTEAFNIFFEKMFLKNSSNAPQLESEWTNLQYLDAINKPLVGLEQPLKSATTAAATTTTTTTKGRGGKKKIDGAYAVAGTGTGTGTGASRR